MPIHKVQKKRISRVTTRLLRRSQCIWILEHERIHSVLSYMGDNAFPIVHVHALGAQAFESCHEILQYRRESGRRTLKFLSNFVQESKRLFRWEEERSSGFFIIEGKYLWSR
jgi:hypothetical protein